jgi:hypothetical protein
VEKRGRRRAGVRVLGRVLRPCPQAIQMVVVAGGEGLVVVRVSMGGASVVPLRTGGRHGGLWLTVHWFAGRVGQMRVPHPSECSGRRGSSRGLRPWSGGSSRCGDDRLLVSKGCEARGGTKDDREPGRFALSVPCMLASVRAACLHRPAGVQATHDRQTNSINTTQVLCFIAIEAEGNPRSREFHRCNKVYDA